MGTEAENETELERLKAFNRDFADELVRLRTENQVLRDGIEQIADATVRGDVCDDVAWFNKYETLHDRCLSLLEWSGDQKTLGLYTPRVPDGVSRIATERRRQITHKGYTAEHDDAHGVCELAVAAACYALSSAAIMHPALKENVRGLWPWRCAAPDGETFKEDEIKNLERAGALAAAEIDRLTRT